MNPERLLQNFDRLIDTPNAVPRLRRFILDLAVRGKLVEQNPEDEPAVELLKIATSSVVVTFELPNKWVSARAGKLLNIQYGKARPAKDRSDRGRVPVYGSNGIVGYCEESLSEEAAIIIGLKGSAGALKRCDGPSWTTDVAYFLIPPVFFNIRFLFTVLETLDLGSLGKGVKPGLSRSEAYQLPIMVPPLAEQHRIVRKVDELMKLCDELEAAQVKREKRRDRLVIATLHGLNNGDSESDTSERLPFKDSARFYFNHLPQLSTRPEHIQQLRQIILNLAVQGKLVSQDPKDEPASELLKRILAEKVRLVMERKIKKEKAIATIQSDSVPFEIPTSWKWVRLDMLTEVITKGSSPKWQGVQYVSKDNGVLFITSENVGNYRLRKMDMPKYVEKRFNEIESRSILRFGDILMNLVGASIGRTALYDLNDEANINQAVAVIRLVQCTPNLCRAFFLHYFNSPFAIQLMLASQVVTAQPNISLTNAREFPVPVPPLSEQYRIMTKVDELMSLCDLLYAKITTNTTASRQLLEAALQEAVSVEA